MRNFLINWRTLRPSLVFVIVALYVFIFFGSLSVSIFFGYIFYRIHIRDYPTIVKIERIENGYRLESADGRAWLKLDDVDAWYSVDDESIICGKKEAWLNENLKCSKSKTFYDETTQY